MLEFLWTFYTIYSDNINRQAIFTAGEKKLAEKDNASTIPADTRTSVRLCVRLFKVYFLLGRICLTRRRDTASLRLAWASIALASVSAHWKSLASLFWLRFKENLIDLRKQLQAGLFSLEESYYSKLIRQSFRLKEGLLKTAIQAVVLF